MIKAKDAIREARKLIGTPYSELDCINLIKKVIRDAPGGVKGYTTAGTNSLWDSYEMSRKYKDLTWRQEGITGAREGMIAFKRYGADDEGHAGIVTDAQTVIHASSVYGKTVETPLTEREGWDLLAIHRYIEIGESVKGDTDMESYTARVTLKDESSHLNVRSAPKDGDIIGRLGHGAQVVVQAMTDGWAFISYGDSGSGYVSAAYLREVIEEIEDDPVLREGEDAADVLADTEYFSETTLLINKDTGAMIELVGHWRVAED